MRALLLWPFLILMQCVGGSDAAEHRRVERAVYSALVDSCCLTRRDSVPEVAKEVLIEERLHGGPAAFDDYVTRWLRDSVPGLPQDAIADFLLVTRDTSFVQPFTLRSQQVRLLSDSTIRPFFAGEARRTKGWIAFRAAFPNGGPIRSVSRVGLSHDRRWAIVYAGWQGDWLAGAGLVYVLHRDRDAWRIRDELMLWVS